LNRISRQLLVFLVIGFFCFNFGKSVDEYINEAQGYLTTNNIEQAIATMEQAVKEYPDSSVVYTYLGVFYSERAQGMTDFSKIFEVLETTFAMWDKAVELDPNNFEALFYRGAWGVSIPKFAGRTQNAVMDLEAVVMVFEQSGDPSLQEYLVQAYHYLGTGYQKLMELQKAKMYYNKVISAAPGTDLAEQAQGNLSRIVDFEKWQAKHDIQTKVDNPQINELEQKLAKDPGDIGLILSLGQQYLDVGRYQDAAGLLQEATRMDSTNVDIYKLLALALQNYAGEEYNARISLDTDFRTDLAFGLMAVLDKAVAVAPDDIELRFWRGVAGVNMPFFVGKLEQSIDELNLVVQSDLPDADKAQALYWLGLAYQKKAMTHWIQVVTEYPDLEAAQMVFDEITPRIDRLDLATQKKPYVMIDFIMGFRDELAPQSAVWIEDKDGKFIRTIYVSGFSGYARGKQVNLPMWSHSSEYKDVDGVTAASIDIGHHVYVWDLKDFSGKKVKSGEYAVIVEVAFWPSMQYQRVSAMVEIGKKNKKVIVEEGNLIPYLEIDYTK
jgi:tetratricopeptide (TPR) repeat protein